MLTNWRIKEFNPSEGEKLKVYKSDYHDNDWLPIQVPGDVHAVLVNNGVIDDPFYDRNEGKCRWVEEKEWWYRIQFPGEEKELETSESLLLTFYGIDTFATIWFNGREIGRTENMFRKYEFDISESYLFNAVNTIAICFDPALNHENRSLSFQSWGPNPERVSLRKAQYHYGWDWGPRLPTVGLWQPVEIKRRQGVYLDDIHFYTLNVSPDKQKALTALDVQVYSGIETQPLKVLVQLEDQDGNSVVEQLQELKLNDPASINRIYLTVNKPELWWIHDLGEPYLYKLKVRLYASDLQVDFFEHKVGIRTIELDQSPDFDEPGTRFFRFVLNGVPVFAKGANWIPSDSFVGSLDQKNYQKFLQKAQTGNVNMLRIWGGGIYEHDWFYDYCNQFGILVWQDFMFACAVYPEEPDSFVQNVTKEAEYQVNRLKNHPCMALWCGNNENQWIHDSEHWDELNFPLPGNLYYHSILPDIIKKHDGHIPYWPGSPYGGDDHNSMDDGDRHNWDVWHGNLPRKFGEKPRVDQGPEGVAYKNYAKDTGRFISEFGMHASPVLETLKRCLPVDQLYFHSPSMDHHNKDFPKNKGDNLMLPVTGLPENLEEYINYSMIAQAEGLKFAVEHFRRRKPHCSGTLIWQFNDCWPCLSWSVVDYYGFEKAGYHYMRRAFSPVLASFKSLENGDIEVWITNDTLDSVTGNIVLRHAHFDGHVEWLKDVEINVPANRSLPVYTLSKRDMLADEYHYLSVASYSDMFPKNRHFYNMIKDLRRKKPVLDISHQVIDDKSIRFEISTDSYAHFVHFEYSDETITLSDNYFDLAPGETKILTVRHSGSLHSGELFVKTM